MKDKDFKGLLVLAIGIVSWFALMVLLVGCGTQTVKVKGGTQNNVRADAKVNVILTIDLRTCDDFGTAAKLDCIIAITGALESLGDLSKVLVCDPNDQEKCDLLDKILDGVK